jgi:hypothetical protein
MGTLGAGGALLGIEILRASLDIVGADADPVEIGDGVFGALAVEVDQVGEGQDCQQGEQEEDFHLKIIIEKNRNQSLNWHSTLRILENKNIIAFHRDAPSNRKR